MMFNELIFTKLTINQHTV